MQKNTFFKTKIFYLSLIFSFLFLIPITHAAQEWFPDPIQPNSAYVYNNEVSPTIKAINADDALNYDLTILNGIDVTNNPFKIDGSITTFNYYNDVVIDTDAILGYAWSKRVGWINFSHGMKDYIPRFESVGANKVLTGYIYSELSGWIQLSSVEDLATGQQNFDGLTTTKDNMNNWGVVYDELNNKFIGFAWGPGLGWIDFSTVTFNDTTGKFGGYACSNGCSTPTNDKIYFAFSSTAPGIPQETAGGLTDWGVSKNMSKVVDFYERLGETCDLISEDCIGNAAPDLSYFHANFEGDKIFLNLPNRLEQKGDHDFTEVRITNRFGQTISSTTTNTYKSVLWPTNCGIDATSGLFTCDAPNITFSLPDDTAIADGVDKIGLAVELTNNTGFPITEDTDSITNIVLTLQFDNTVRQNQLGIAGQAAGTRDAVSFIKVNEASAVVSDLVDLNLITIDANGKFNVDITSVAPAPVQHPTNNSIWNKLDLIGFELTIALKDFPDSSFTFTQADYSFTPLSFNFKPALTASISGFNALIENAPSEFNVTLKNNSATENISDINLSNVFDGILALLGAEIKAKDATNPWSDTTLDMHQLIYTGGGGTYLIQPQDPIVNNTDFLQSLAVGAEQELTVSITPKLWILGDTIDLTKPINFNTEVAYRLPSSASHTYHPSETLDMTTGAVQGQVEIIGLSSGDHIYSIYSGSTLNNIGGMSFGEMSEEIRRNVANLTRNETGHPLPQVISTWTDKDRINGGKVLYFKGSPSDKVLTLGGGSDFVIPDTAGTIIVEGGDVYIKNNLKYGNDGLGNGSLGLIVMKDASGNGGDVYIDPAVTNLVGGIYAEGSLMGASDSAPANSIENDEIYDGFNGDKTDLNNQLLIKGTLITHNTIGGSRQNPIDFPVTVDETCGSLNDGSMNQECAERYDLNYIRNFVTSGSTALNGGSFANPQPTSNAPFVIEYDPRIQTNIPPAFEMSQSIDFQEVLQ